VALVFALNLGGVLRAAGDTRTVLVASLTGDAFLVPLAWLLALELDLGPRGLMLAWLAYGLVYLAVSWWRYHTGAWRTATVQPATCGCCPFAARRGTAGPHGPARPTCQWC
jgi:Na+-driven multidrug efflux pump